MSEFQRLRCRVAFHALLGHQMVERLRAWGRPFLAYHPDTLAYHGCAELFQDVHTELIQYRRAQMIKQGIIKEKISVDSHLHRKWFSCLERYVTNGIHCCGPGCSKAYKSCVGYHFLVAS
ncbi:hypothetical protein V6N13_114321 [Hibiscus sabdariffa]